MTIVTGTCGQELVDKGGQIPADTRLKESVLAGSVETLKNTTTPMSWCGSLNTLDGWSSIKLHDRAVRRQVRNRRRLLRLLGYPVRLIL